MKGKLIKRDDDYFLMNSDIAIATTRDGYINMFKGIGIIHKLSLKNCQAIENGYDLDELARENNKHHKRLGTEIDKLPLLTAALRQGYTEGYKEGFQKALEILGDKNFSEEDMIKMWEAGANRVFIDTHPIPDYKATIQSLQQTEWDCIIEMDTNCTGEFKYFLLYEGKPKLDAEGCLILKRK